MNHLIAHRKPSTPFAAACAAAALAAWCSMASAASPPGLDPAKAGIAVYPGPRPTRA